MDWIDTAITGLQEAKKHLGPNNDVANLVTKVVAILMKREAASPEELAELADTAPIVALSKRKKPTGG